MPSAIFTSYEGLAAYDAQFEAHACPQAVSWSSGLQVGSPRFDDRARPGRQMERAESHPVY
jgi:hypothetical protein